MFTAGAVAVKLQALGEGYFWNYLFLTLATFTVKLITVKLFTTCEGDVNQVVLNIILKISYKLTNQI